MNLLSKKTACVVDRGGLFTHIAVCLAEQFGKVFYVGPPERVNPKVSDDVIGHGFPNLVRVPDLWTVKRHSDIFVFPDIGLSGEQIELRDQGKPVWGHFGADELESDKSTFLAVLENVGLPVPPHRRIKGYTSLRRHLEDKRDVYVKISHWRGDWETFHWRDRAMDESELEIRSLRLGPVRDHIWFYVFDKIDTDIEDGIDAWFAGGQWPKRILHAMERKDKSLLGAMMDYADVSQDMRAINEAMGPVLERHGYQGAFSSEARLAQQAFFIDATCRFGSPPSQLQTAMFRNLPEIIYGGAHGVMVEADAPEEIGAQVLITTDREKDEWLAFPMPDELRPHVKTSFSFFLDGAVHIAPNPLENCAGWLVATGKTIEQVIGRLKDYKLVLPDGFDCDLTSLADLLRELESAEEKGVKITDQPIPPPQVVLEGKT